jgi:hypothetical protein
VGPSFFGGEGKFGQVTRAAKLYSTTRTISGVEETLFGMGLWDKTFFTEGNEDSEGRRGNRGSASLRSALVRRSPNGDGKKSRVPAVWKGTFQQPGMGFCSNEP